MSFLYPRLITITRPNPDTGVGAQSYGGVQEANEQVVMADVPARIQIDQQGVASPAKLPADAMRESVWKILFVLPLGTVDTGDIITDEIGNRFQVVAPYWGPLVTTCRCQVLKT